MLSRNTPPPLLPLQQLDDVRYTEHTLRNGIKLYAINTGTQEVVRVSLVFNAGTRYQTQKLVAGATLALMSEGTQRYSAQQVAEGFDFLGSAYEQSIDKDYAMLNVYSLNKHLDKSLEILNEIVQHPTFAEAELKTYAAKRKQQLKIEQEQVVYTARQEFLSALYGKEHPYGTFAEPKDFDLLQSFMLKDFHCRYFVASCCFIVASGKIGAQEIAAINKHLENITSGKRAALAPLSESQISVNENITITKEGAVQSAIRYGKLLFNKNHPDYAALQVLCMVLGGYMGSRLMQNIREEKGYTYGIFATLINYERGGHLSIGTEVGAGLANATVAEIEKELERLRTALIPEEELELVRSYMCGEIIRCLDGPWAQAEALIENLQCKLTDSYATTLFNEVKNITPKRLQELAQQYFDPKSMTCVIAG
ncbi:MAG: insulinase family protein [Prevotellaceae bacterium]|jgi:predicted Zn-dependent peptidase|nr:insulinase family protein [Prevotellaceae bacterium]